MRMRIEDSQTPVWMLVHDKYYPIICDKCGAGFNKRKKLQKHLYEEHSY